MTDLEYYNNYEEKLRLEAIEYQQELDLTRQKEDQARKSRLKNAIKEVKSCPASWIRENLKANLNPLFTKQDDGSESLSFGIDNHSLQFSFQNTERYTKKEILDELSKELEMCN